MAPAPQPAVQEEPAVEAAPALPSPEWVREEAASDPCGAGEENSAVADCLEEVDFYLQQELLEEAVEALASLQEEYPDHPEVLARLEKIERLKAGAPVVSVETSEESSGDFDLAAEIASEMGEEEESSAPLCDAFQYSADDVFSAFKKGVEKVVDRADSATHFDLGIAYREMGLIDDAISEFSIAAQDPSRKVSSLSMIGLCFSENGQYSEAINRFREALHGPIISENETTGLYYEMGRVYELLQNVNEALFFYRKVKKRDAGFRDVTARLTELEKSAPGPEEPVNPEAAPEDKLDGKAEEGQNPKTAKKSTNKISYM